MRPFPPLLPQLRPDTWSCPPCTPQVRRRPWTRIIDSCPPHAQNQIRTQLSTILKGVITQALIPLAMGGGRVAATEILVGTDAVGSLIRDNKCFQLATVMQSGAALGMHTLNADLARLVRAGTIRREDAIRVSNNKNEILDLLS